MLKMDNFLFIMYSIKKYLFPVYVRNKSPFIPANMKFVKRFYYQKAFMIL